jgi:NAD(P)H dehydrogenase (quinone)
LNVLIVHAHHEPASFNNAMTAVAVNALSGAGHEVRVSDLYAMAFDPVSDRRNFLTTANADRLDQQAEERHAAKHDGFAPDVAGEMEKVAWCDLVLFQFPLWWMGMPAIMKGWIDRVFALGFAYGDGRWFDRGWLAGKRAMLSVTVGGSAETYGDRGLYGSIDSILEPIHHGVLRFVGLSVMTPFVVHAPGRIDHQERARVLRRYATELQGIAARPLDAAEASKQ